MGQLNVSTRADGRVALRTLARPERLNALSAPLLDALEGAIADADDRPEVRAVVVAGEGRAFCAAADIAELQGASRQQAALRAGELGVVNRVAGDGEALDTALDWATRLTERPPLAIGVTKRVIGLVVERLAQTVLYATEDKREGTSAFLAKREPTCQGRQP